MRDKLIIPFSYHVLPLSEGTCPVCGSKLVYIQYSARLEIPFVTRTDIICSYSECGISIEEYRKGVIKERTLVEIRENLRKKRV